jgi:hypothetical protein
VHAAGLDLPATGAACALHAEAGEAGLSELDMSVPYDMLRRRAQPQRASGQR